MATSSSPPADGGAPLPAGTARAACAPEVAVREILALLNSLSLGEIGRVRAELASAAASLEALGQPELALRVAEAGHALAGGNLKEYRRALSNVTARLGHVR